MGIDAADDGDAETGLEAFAEALGTKNITFVDALNSQIRTLIDSARDIRYEFILGDVSSASRSSNGHLHFDLVHNESKVHCVIFRSRLHSMSATIENGVQVAVRAELSYHEPNGRVSLLVNAVVEMGTGIYELTYRENKECLEKDGLLDEETKLPLPTLPRRIGIATSATSDAREDAVTSIRNRHPGVDIVIQNTSVQGDDAMLSMMQAISELDDDPLVDVIVLTRGGGADKHLRVFNETPLCRVIHRTDTPTVVAIGHEADRTLADDVADERVMTPTEVGEIVPREDDLDDLLSSMTKRLTTVYERTVKTRLENVEQQLQNRYEYCVSGELATLSEELDHKFETVAAKRLTSLQSRLDHMMNSYQQQQAHEKEKADIEDEYGASHRRQQIVMAILVLAILLLLGHIIL